MTIFCVKNSITDGCFIRKSIKALITNEHYCLRVLNNELKLSTYTLYQLMNASANVSFLPLLATPLVRRPYLSINLHTFTPPYASEHARGHLCFNFTKTHKLLQKITYFFQQKYVVLLKFIFLLWIQDYNCWWGTC